MKRLLLKDFESSKMTNYTPTIGLEIHTELKTNSKLFCGCNNDPFCKEPNIHTCPVCLGLPGALPVINISAVESVIKVGKALGGEIAKITKWDRKNYSYPDLPKGYQISQFDQPLVTGGQLEIRNPKFEIRNNIQNSPDASVGIPTPNIFGSSEKFQNDINLKQTIKITRIHLEEDTGKLLHPQGTNYSLIDYNRSGVPLMELVTEPDIQTGKEASEFAKKFQQLLRHMNVADANMERGQMRIEVNISLKEDQKDTPGVSEGVLGTKVEIKNLNSFKSVEKAIDYEINRQVKLLENSERVVQETRGWDDDKQITFSQRVKETENDYRYFPEPDLPPLSFSNQYLDSIKVDILPDNVEQELIDKYNLKPNEARILISNREKLNLFNESREVVGIKESDLATFIINKGPKTVEDILNYYQSKKDLISLEKLEEILIKIIKENSEVVDKIKNGKIEAKQALVGLVMKETKGKASGEMTKQILEKLLNKEINGKNKKSD